MPARKKQKTRLHKALGTHPHKHTGKLLPHKHTSYRVLFGLMLITAMIMATVNWMSAQADDLAVNAVVPAQIPSGTPTIDSPVDGFTTQGTQVTVSGTCPVITPAIIIAIYDNAAIAGSVSCDNSGNYAVPISLTIGNNSLVATVKTFTGGTGNSSSPVNVVRHIPPAPPSTPSTTIVTPPTTVITPELLVPVVRIIPKDPFISIGSSGHVTWTGRVEGGSPPYKLSADWGDGNVDRRSVTDHSLQTFEHTYKTPRVYALLVKATDVKGVDAILYSTAVSAVVRPGNPLDVAKTPEVLPVVSFIQQNSLQIFAVTFTALVFLWYLEHGRNVLFLPKSTHRHQH